MATRSIPIAAALAVLVLAAGPAAADVLPYAAPGVTAPPPPPPPLPPRLQVGFHGAMRVTVLDSHGDRWEDDALAYGWRAASATPLLGGSVDVSYLWAPIVDVGVSAGWMAASYAAGIDPEDRLRVRATSIAGTARLHWMRGVPFVPEPRLDLGVIRERTEIHGTSDTRYVTYVRAGIDWRLGTKTVGATIALGYTMVDRDAGNPVAPPIGGLDLGAGPYFRF